MSKPKCLGAVLLGALAATALARADDKQPLTVIDSIEMRRVLDPFEPVALSPNGQRFLIRLARDDLDQNGTWVEIIAGELDSLSKGARTVATLFTTSELDRDTGRKSPIYPGRTKLAWLDDNERVAFRWNDGATPTQVYTLNVRTGEVATLTKHPTSIEDFTVVPGGSRVVYVAAIDRARLRAERFDSARRNGLVVSATHVLPLLEGNLDGEFDHLHLETYVTNAKGNSRVVRCEETIRCKWMRFAPENISPDGKYAITLKAPAAVIPDEWSAYGEVELQRDIVAARRNPDAYGLAHRINRIGMLDLDGAELKSLVDAPVYATGSSPKLDWAPDARRIVVGPIFLPVGLADESGLSGLAVAEIDLMTGQISTVPVPPEFAKNLQTLRWNSANAIVLFDGKTSVRYRKTNGRWKQAGTGLEGIDDEQNVARVRVELRQDLNVPPALYAIDRGTGEERLVVDVEPRLRSKYTLGRVEAVEWMSSDGRNWRGRLHYPVSYSPERRYPLVIQLDAPDVGAEPEKAFSLLGAGDIRTAGYAAQALANRDMLVLSLSRGQHQRNEAHGNVIETPIEAKVYMRGIESAIAHFAGEGFVDSHRVALIGYSRTGWYVEYAVSHSQVPFAAAIAVDNVDYGYVEAVLFAMEDEFFRPIGAPPLGKGLQEWLKESPGFNSHHVRTPIRLEVDTGGINGVLGSWETYTLLRYQKKPVELVVVPQFEHGEHPLQVPAQKRFSQEGTVDWMDFWLNGREDPDPCKAEQYQRWRVLREQQERVIEERRAAGERIPDLPPLQTSRRSTS